MSTLLNKHKKLEEGGVLGIYSYDRDISKDMFFALYGLQHRGQTSCGITTNDNWKLSEVKGKGLVAEVIEPDLHKLKGNIAAGHVKYGNPNDLTEILPLTSTYLKGSLTVSLGGTITNSEELKSQMEDEGAIFQSASDAEILMHLIVRSRAHHPSIEQAVLSIMNKVQGAFAAVIMTGSKLLAFRDSDGYRPLALGQIGNGYIVASEDTAFLAVNAKRIRDIAPGELVLLNKDGLKSFFSGENDKKAAKTCIYEYMYFARPDSTIDDISVYQARIEAGKKLFDSCPASADIVIGVPSAGMHFALGYARRSGIPFGDGLIRNYYLGRASDRDSELHRDSLDVKLSVIKSAVQGHDVVLVDDSMIQGFTAKKIIAKLKENGAKKIHLRIACPRFESLCPYSPSLSGAALKGKSVEELRQMCGADSLAFLPKSDLDEIGLSFACCKKCFDKSQNVLEK